MALLGLAPGRALLGQDSTSTPIPQTTIVDRRFAVGEPVSLRVPLQRGIVYRIWISRPAQIRGLPKERRIFPYVVDVTRSSLIDNGAEFEVYPAYTGPVTLLVEPPTPDSVTDVVIWRDVRGTVRGDPDQGGADGNWEFGFGAAGGWHGIMGGGRSGASYEGCMEVRRGGGRRSRISGCLLGLATYLRPGTGKISIFFVEPHLRLSNAALTLLHGGNEAGMAFRLGIFGSAEGSDPSWGGVNVLGVGPYLEHAFGDPEHANGWGVRLSLMAETGAEGTAGFSTFSSRVGVNYHF